MSNRELPSPEILSQLLRYEPDTGKLFWRPRQPEMFSDGQKTASHCCAVWNARNAGKEAFINAGLAGHKKGWIFNRPYFAHRVIWAMHTGQWPADEIDHINGDPTDNRLENLRAATHSENMRNRRGNEISSSKWKGVSFFQPVKKWRASISLGSTLTHLGYFTCEIEAAKAYDAAARLRFGEFARTNFPIDADS